jgi:Icc-related predicted phosphoesterase
VIVAFFGDTHGELKLMWQIAQDWQERTGSLLDCIVQVGDLGVYPGPDRVDPATVKHAKKHGYSLVKAVGDFPEVYSEEYQIPIPTYFIRGNHEDQEFLMNYEKRLMELHPGDHLQRCIEICTNLFYIPDGHIIKLGDIKLAGWGGCWGQKTWDMDYWSSARCQPNNRGYTRKLNHMTRDRFEHLMRSGFDILVTHDAPTGTGVKGFTDRKAAQEAGIEPTEDVFGGPGVGYIRELIEEVKPRYHFNGHYHEYHKNLFAGDRTTAFVLGRVYPEGETHLCMEVLEL